MKMPAYSEITPTVNTKVLGYESTSPESTHVYDATLLGGGGGIPINIYNIDGTLTEDRTVDADSFGMQLINLGDFLIQSTEGVGIVGKKSLGFQVEDVPTPGTSAVSFTLPGTLDTEVSFLLSTITEQLLTLYGSGKLSIAKGLKIGEFSVLSNASVIFDVVSTSQLSRPFPSMTTAQRNAISSPAVGSMVYVTDGTEGIYVRKSSGWTFVA